MATILIVDDEKSIRRTLGQFLRDDGHEVVEAEDADTAFQRLQETEFDVVVTDIILPRVTGVELLRRLRATAPHVQVVIMTGEPTVETASESLRAGAADYLFKPITKTAIVRVVANAARIKSLEDIKRRLEAENRAYQETLEQLVEQRTRQLHASEERACELSRFNQGVLDALSARICVLAEDGTIIAVNQAWEDLRRGNPPLAAGAGVGTNYVAVCEAVTGEDKATAQNAVRGLRTVAQGGLPEFSLEYPCHSPDTQRWFVLRATRFAGEGPVRIVVAHENITARKRAEESLRQREEYFRALIENGSDVISVFNPDGTIRYQSPSLERVLGYSLEEMLGRNGFDLIHPEDAARVRSILAAGFGEAGSQAREELRFRHKDGSWRVLESVGRNLTADSNVRGVVVNSRDVTERKELEAELRQAQKMEAIGQLAGGIAHDFNNMLAVILGTAELLQIDSDQLSAEVKEGLSQIVHASDSAANLTRQLLIFSRKQVMQSQPLLLNDLIGNLTKMLKRTIREDIRLECRFAEQLPFVQADPGMVEQVLLNLVVNARDAMPEGGQLLITTERAGFGTDIAQTNPEARPGEFVCLSVSDTGTGIAPEHLSRIFEPFFTTKEPGKGTGLGLATVYGIVKQHAGWIELSSRVGQGTTFKIFLPAGPPPTNVGAVPAAEAKVRGGSETILLVEDEGSVRAMARRVLEYFGYTVREATCGREALEIWDHQESPIALLLTDMVMPGGLNGRELAERLRGQRPDLRVIFMSGYNSEVLGKNTEFFRKFKDHFLHKPFSTENLGRAVRRCLDEI